MAKNFWEGLVDEALPNSFQRTMADVMLPDERSPDPIALLSNNVAATVAVSDNVSSEHGAIQHAEKQAAFVKEDDENKNRPESSREPSSSSIVVVQWTPEEEEALNPRWTNLAESFKDAGMQ